MGCIGFGVTPAPSLSLSTLARPSSLANSAGSDGFNAGCTTKAEFSMLHRDASKLPSITP